MEKKIKLALIVVWSILAIVFTAILTFSLSRGGKLWNFTGAFDRSWGGNLTETYHKTFSADGIMKISVSGGAADVNVVPSDTAEIKVIRKSVKDAGGSFTVRSENGVLDIRNETLDTGIHLFHFGRPQTVEIDLPASYGKAVSVDDGSGNIVFQGKFRFTSADIRTGSGDISADSIRADEIKLKSGAGDISADTVEAGSYSAVTGSGNVDLKNLGGSGALSTNSGDITASVSRLGGDLSLSTGSGDIRLSLPQDADARIKANTGSGDIRAGVPLTYSGWSKNSAEGTVGSGSYSLTLRTGSGDIDLNR